jgi:hypothetical protein
VGSYREREVLKSHLIGPFFFVCRVMVKVRFSVRARIRIRVRVRARARVRDRV